MIFIKTTDSPATAENKKWRQMRVRPFTNFWLRLQIRAQKIRRIVPEVTPDPWTPLIDVRWELIPNRWWVLFFDKC